MKILVLMFCVVLARGADYYDPADLACSCFGSDDPTVLSYDGRLKMILKAQKTILSRWEDDLDDECKFQVRVVTKDDIDGSSSPLHCDWIAFGYAVHTKNNAKYQHNFLFANDVSGEGKVAIRGQGFQGPQLLDLSSPYTDTIGSCHWTVTKVGNHKFTFRSDCCPYALDWLPNGIDSQWKLWVSDGTKYKDGKMEGMCGDCDGDIKNDWVTCSDPSTILDITDDALSDISDSCEEGDHSGVGFFGGRRLG